MWYCFYHGDSELGKKMNYNFMEVYWVLKLLFFFKITFLLSVTYTCYMCSCNSHSYQLYGPLSLECVSTSYSFSSTTGLSICDNYWHNQYPQGCQIFISDNLSGIVCTQYAYKLKTSLMKDKSHTHKFKFHYFNITNYLCTCICISIFSQQQL